MPGVVISHTANSEPQNALGWEGPTRSIEVKLPALHRTPQKSNHMPDVIFGVVLLLELEVSLLGWSVMATLECV